MKEQIHSGGIALKCDAEDAAIAAALHDEADIPEVSASFARRCLAAAGASGGVAREHGAFRLVGIAAAAAVLASVATWVAAMRVADARSRAGEASAALPDDVLAVGVKASAGSGGAAAASAESVATSNECMVNTNPGATIFWKALNAGQSQMAWEWPDGAKSAKLTITGRGMTAEKIYGKADAFPVWNPPVPDDFNEDDVYTARLTFYSGLKGTGGEVSQLVANGIGFVRGVSGAAPHVTGWGASGAKPAMFGAVRWVVCGR